MSPTLYQSLCRRVKQSKPPMSYLGLGALGSMKGFPTPKQRSQRWQTYDRLSQIPSKCRRHKHLSSHTRELWLRKTR